MGIWLGTAIVGAFLCWCLGALFMSSFDEIPPIPPVIAALLSLLIIGLTWFAMMHVAGVL